MVMSALPPKADMCRAQAHVCYGPIADICRSLFFVAFRLLRTSLIDLRRKQESRYAVSLSAIISACSRKKHVQCHRPCPLWANSGHYQDQK